MAVGDTGERLSHAVGCAFGICLENKQKRDKANVSIQYESKDASFTRNGSFRVGTISERLADPQSMKFVDVATPKSLPSVSENEDIKPVERPRPTELMYQRQASFRGLGQISGHTPFKRHSRGHISLRLNDLPSNLERRAGMITDEPILEDIELPASNLEDNSSKSLDLLSGEDPFTAAEMAAYSGISGSSTPALRGCDTSSTYSTSPPPTLLVPTRLHKLAETPESEMLNPWEHVPDQPAPPTQSTVGPAAGTKYMELSASHHALGTGITNGHSIAGPSSLSHNSLVSHGGSDGLQLHLTNTTNAIQQLSLNNTGATNVTSVISPAVPSTSDYSSTPGIYSILRVLNLI